VSVLATVVLGAEHAVTGFTHHVDVWPDGTEEEVRPPSRLRIIREDGDAGVLLLYEDGSGNWLSDTYHESVEDAMGQAELEFTVRPRTGLGPEDHRRRSTVRGKGWQDGVGRCPPAPHTLTQVPTAPPAPQARRRSGQQGVDDAPSDEAFS
jgi:hypothetical protein